MAKKKSKKTAANLPKPDGTEPDPTGIDRAQQQRLADLADQVMSMTPEEQMKFFTQAIARHRAQRRQEREAGIRHPRRPRRKPEDG